VTGYKRTLSLCPVKLTDNDYLPEMVIFATNRKMTALKKIVTVQTPEYETFGV